MIDRWIAEATECDFKVALEVKKPKSWLKSVSAFANGIGGTLFFGIDNDRNAVGLDDAQTDAEAISRLIKARITPYPSFILAPERKDDKDILVLSVSAGRSTPYYYKADGIMEAYIRIGNESVIAPSYVLNQLILKGMHRTYDELVSEYKNKTPVIPFSQRIEIVNSIKYVDETLPQETMDKFAQWEKIHYDVLLHGDDWKNSDMYNDIEEKLNAVGVEVVFLPHTDGISSTDISTRLRR